MFDYFLAGIGILPWWAFVIAFVVLGVALYLIN